MQDNKSNNLKYHENVIETWSHDGYNKYRGSYWRWADLPFRDELINGDYSFKEYFNQTLKLKLKKKKILEIGSAMGSAYEFMEKSNLIDLENYTGIEVSRIGIDYCNKNHHKANWIHKDFTKLENLDTYDYVFERNAIHHMPNPNKQYEKIFKSTKIAFSTCFRSCLKGGTISDLSISNFKTETGTYFSSIINLFEIIELGIKHGFGNIKITFGGPHEIISNNPKASHFISPKINQKEIFLSRCKLLMVKTDYKKHPQITLVARPDIALNNIKAMVFIYSKLKEIKRNYSK